MNMKKYSVLLFEDSKVVAEKICNSITRSIPDDFTVSVFHPEREGDPDATSRPPFDQSIEAQLGQKKFSNAILMVSDRDLSTIKGFEGLSEAIISKVAENLSIPMCLYAKGYSADFIDRAMNWSEGKIILNSTDMNLMGEEISIIAQGFSKISTSTAKLLKVKKNNPRTPAEFMAVILEREDLADRIAMYASGDRKAALPVLRTLSNPSDLSPRILTTFLGTWLYESILRFPGIVVNKVAASSYLNIDLKEFEANPKIARLFSSAEYQGPFSSRQNPRWWRDRLDLIISGADCTDGRQFAESKLKIKVKSCKCSIDRKSDAGYFCMASLKPVSFEHSKGNITWFPPGADLARINNETYDKFGPWLGLF
jgi:hypothetical protein